MKPLHQLGLVLMAVFGIALVALIVLEWTTDKQYTGWMTGAVIGIALGEVLVRVGRRRG